MSMTVAFLGLGAMGAPMATNLIAAGCALRVWNRTPARAQAFAERGAQVCASVAQAVSGADVVVSIIADDHATREVMLGEQGVLATAAAGTVIVDCSTNTPGLARELARTAAAKGLSYLDAPVSGSTAQAASRELVFMVGGDAAAFEAAQAVWAALGKQAVHMGASGAGATIKLINNMLSGTLNAALAEALAVAEAAGLEATKVTQVLAEGAVASRLTRSKIPKVFKRDFAPQFQLALMDKDVRYFLALAQEVDRPVPVASAVRNQLQAARRSGLGGLDVSAVFMHVSGESATR